MLVALLLWLASTALIVATNDMGFVRDEAFYFEYAERYQDWFVRVEQGGEERKKALSRGEILETWRGNSEHPPLDKILFGYAWRLLGRKLRPLEALRQQDAAVMADITGLGPAHGYQVGASVQVLRPQLVGQDPAPRGRSLVQGQVVERTASRAVVKLAADVDLAKLKQACPGPGPDVDGKVIRRTGCETVEVRGAQIFSESTAMRFPTAVFGGLIVALIYLAGRLFFAGRLTAAGQGRLERPFALLAALGYLAIPQVFWHAHLTTFDTTTVAMLMLTVLAWQRALWSRPWMGIAAVAWGLALLTKHNALFLPIPLLAVWFWSALAERRIALQVELSRRALLAHAAVALLGLGLGAALIHPVAGLGLGLLVLASPRIRLELPPVPGVFVAMLFLGPAILVAGWPLLWVDTLDNLLRWIEFHLHHDHYMQTYFGQVLAYPPFPAAFPWVMTALTWPLTLLAPVLLGLLAVYGPLRRPRLRPVAGALERRDGWLFGETPAADGTCAELRGWDRLVLLSALWPMALISMPGTPIFGGTKHWMPAFPFLLLIGARGVQALWRRLAQGPSPQPLALEAGEVWRPGPLARAAAWLLALVLLVPAAQATAETYRDGSAYYNELVGGIPGAAQAGMQRQFWGGGTRAGLEFVNQRAPANASIWFHKCAYWAYLMYQREGWFRRDLRFSYGPEGTALGFFHHQKDHDDFELDAMRDYGTRAPVFQQALDGVPLLSVYERPRPEALR